MSKQSLPGAEIPDEPEFSSLLTQSPANSAQDIADIDSTVEKLKQQARGYPSIAPSSKNDPMKERLSSSLSLPKYVWKQLKASAFNDELPQTAIVMIALKLYGLEIDDEDLVDQRTIRHK